MPDGRRAQERLTAAQVEEVVESLDRIAAILGQPSFSSQMQMLQSTLQEQRHKIQEETGMTNQDMDMVVEQVPELMSETLGQTFAAMSASMEQVLKDPDKMKQAFGKKE